MTRHLAWKFPDLQLYRDCLAVFSRLPIEPYNSVAPNRPARSGCFSQGGSIGSEAYATWASPKRTVPDDELDGDTPTYPPRESAGNPQLADYERRSCVEQSSSLVAVEVLRP